MGTVPQALLTRREDLIARLAQDDVYDIAVVGGGATGLGVALVPRAMQQLQRPGLVYRALPAALIIGLAWFPWHLPELVSDPGQRPLTPFAVYIFSQSVLLTWLYNSTQASLPVVVLFHAAFNTFTKFFLADLQGSPYPYLVAWWVVAGAVAVLAVAAVAYAGSRDLVKGAPRPAH